MSKEEKMHEMMKKKVWAVIGATPNGEKTANRIFHTFRDNDYTVYPVNPNYKEMEDGSTCYSCLSDLPQKPECIDFVVPPAVTLSHLKELDPAEFPNIWLQPGTYNEEVLAYAKEKGFNVVHDGACTMAYLHLHGAK